MITGLSWIKKHLITSIIISIILGIFIGSQFNVEWFSNLILPLTFFLVYPMLVPLRFETLKQKVNVKLQVVTQIVNFVVFPFIAFGIGLLFFKNEPYLRLGLLLISLLPTSGMTISWTVLSKGNVNAAIKMVFIGLTLGALLSPFYITGLLGTAISIPTSKIMTQILLVVFIPLLAAYITQKVLIKWKSEAVFHSRIKPIFPLYSTLSVVVIIFIAMALRAKVLLNDPLIVLEIALPLILLYGLFTLISIGVAKLLFEANDAIAFTNGTLVRNLSLSLAIVLSTFTDASISALLIALAYVLQVQIAAWNTRLSPLLFPKKTT